MGPPKIMRTAPYISPNLDFSREWGLLSPARATVTPQGLSRGPKWYPELRHERGQSGDTHSHGGRGVGGDGQLSITAPLEPPVSSVRLEDRAASACKPPPRPRWHMSALPEPGRSSQCPEAAQVRETLALQLPARTPDSRGKQPKTGRAAIDPQRAQASLVIPPGGKRTSSA